MKVLVTGGKGFLGSNISEYLRNLNYDVFTLSRSEDLCDSQHLQVNIFELDEVRQAIKTLRPDVVIHAAWDTTLKTYVHSEGNRTFQEKGLQLASICATYGVFKLLVLGSSAEYGLKTEPVSAEDSSALPISEYGKAKLSLLQNLQENGLDQSLNLGWLRIFQPYGPKQNSDRLFPTLFKAIIEGEDFVVKFPHQIRDWIHVKDICRTVHFVIDKNLSGVFDVGTGIGTSNLDLIRTMEKVLKRKCRTVIEFENATQTVIDCLVVNQKSSLFKAGCNPTIDLESGIRKTLGSIWV